MTIAGWGYNCGVARMTVKVKVARSGAAEYYSAFPAAKIASIRS